MYRPATGEQGAGSHPLDLDQFDPANQADREHVTRLFADVLQEIRQAASAYCSRNPCMLRRECHGCWEKEPGHIITPEARAVLYAKQAQLAAFFQRINPKE